MRKRTIIAVIIILIAVVGLGSNAYFYKKYQDARNDDPNIQTQQIVESLKKTVDVPNETPSVLTVVDKSKLKDTQIAEKAENGDKILLFQKAGEVYIYRPSTNKLVNILNISTNPQQTQQTQQQTTTTQTTQPKSTTNNKR